MKKQTGRPCNIMTILDPDDLNHPLLWIRMLSGQFEAARLRGSTQWCSDGTNRQKEIKNLKIKTRDLAVGLFPIRSCRLEAHSVPGVLVLIAKDRSCNASFVTSILGRRGVTASDQNMSKGASFGGKNDLKGRPRRSLNNVGRRREGWNGLRSGNGLGQKRSSGTAGIFRPDLP